jgi:hypothetical protein
MTGEEKYGRHGEIVVAAALWYKGWQNTVPEVNNIPFTSCNPYVRNYLKLPRGGYDDFHLLEYDVD